MKFLLAIFAGVLALASLASANSPQNDNGWPNTALKWRDGETVILPQSGGTLNAPFQVRLLVGSDAASVLARFVGSAPPFVEALLYRAATNEVVFYQKLGRGYVQFDDWSMFDKDAALTSVAETVEADNRRRQQAGLSSIHVVRWLEAPVLDRSTKSMHWAIEALDDRGRPVVTAVVLIFGRDGFEKLTWGGRALHPNGNLLQAAQASFSFSPGGRHGDYEDGDSIAIYGLADTVAIVLGAKRATK